VLLILVRPTYEAEEASDITNISLPRAVVCSHLLHATQLEKLFNRYTTHNEGFISLIGTVHSHDNYVSTSIVTDVVPGFAKAAEHCYYDLSTCKKSIDEV
jgi:hypothetical protein